MHRITDETRIRGSHTRRQNIKDRNLRAETGFWLYTRLDRTLGRLDLPTFMQKGRNGALGAARFDSASRKCDSHKCQQKKKGGSESSFSRGATTVVCEKQP